MFSLKKIFYSIISIVFLLSGCKLAEIDAEMEENNSFLIVAHRGASAYAPENTLISYKLAEDMHADYIELDIHLTKDKEIVIMHDHDVDKTTEASGAISEYTLAELRELSANVNEKKEKKMDSEPQENLRVPLLREVFNEFGDEMNYMIELKNPRKNVGIEERLVVLLEEYDMVPTKDSEAPKVFVHSFHKKALKHLHALNEDIPLLQLVTFDEGEAAVLSGDELEEIKEYSTAIGVGYKYVDKIFMKDMNNSGLLVFATAVQDARDARKMKEIGTQGIFTDKPDLLKKEFE